MNFQNFLNIIDGNLINANNDFKIIISKIKTDTRILEEGDIFFAIKGDYYDGHDFITEAIEKKCGCIVVDRDMVCKNYIPIIKVTDTKKALLMLANYIRRIYQDIPLIAITGSIGKTTTKELISLVLGKKYHVLKSRNSDNNYIGIPQTLFKLTDDHQVIVMEVGMNHLGEIKELSTACNPDVAVITNIASSHIGNLGSKKNILKAKLEIIEGMKKGTLILNADDSSLKKIKAINGTEIVHVIKEDFKITDIKSTLTSLSFNINKYNKKINFNLPGAHFITNILLAIKVGIMFNVPIDDIVMAIAEYRPLDKRMQVYKLKDDILLIDDCYNASYESIIAGLNTIKNMPNRKIIILGDVLELGKYSKYFHKKIGRYLSKIKNISLLAVGHEVRYIKNNLAHFFKDNHELITYLNNDFIMKKNDIIYIKGSRKIKLELVRDYILEKLKVE